MSDLDTKERLARLRECFPDDDALADHLGCRQSTIGKVARGNYDLRTRPDLQAKIDRLHEQIQKEHAAGLDAVSYALQVIECAEMGTLTDGKIRNAKKILQQKADDLNTAYA